jgi:succinate dehydrogenase/fumarate reductase flavoprotein subunit
MRIYPAVHYTMGGLWVDYNLMGTVAGLHVTGEANFSDHGANRLGASALMQGLADGYFVIPNTIGHYLASNKFEKVTATDEPFRQAEAEVAQRTKKLLSIDGKRTVMSFHRELGKIMWDYCGMARNEEGLKTALRKIPELREEFWRNVNVPGSDAELNQALEKAGRVADFLELGELMCLDALDRTESCGAHFREEFQTPDGEKLLIIALREKTLGNIAVTITAHRALDTADKESRPLPLVEPLAAARAPPAAGDRSLSGPLPPLPGLHRFRHHENRAPLSEGRRDLTFVVVQVLRLRRGRFAW